MDFDWTNWGGLLAIIAIVFLGWAVLKLTVRVALALVLLVGLAFAAIAFGGTSFG